MPVTLNVSAPGKDRCTGTRADHSEQDETPGREGRFDPSVIPIWTYVRKENASMRGSQNQQVHLGKAV